MIILKNVNLTALDSPSEPEDQTFIEKVYTFKDKMKGLVRIFDGQKINPGSMQFDANSITKGYNSKDADTEEDVSDNNHTTMRAGGQDKTSDSYGVYPKTVPSMNNSIDIKPPITEQSAMDFDGNSTFLGSVDRGADSRLGNMNNNASEPNLAEQINIQGDLDSEAFERQESLNKKKKKKKVKKVKSPIDE